MCPIRLQFVDLCILWNDFGELCPWRSNTIGCMSLLKNERICWFLIFECDSQDVVIVFYSQYGWFPYGIENFDTQFEFRMSSLSLLPIYYLWVSLLRQDCRKVWTLPECLELWTKLEEPQGFVICALLLGTTSDATPHDTMSFEWCTHTRSPES